MLIISAKTKAERSAPAAGHTSSPVLRRRRPPSKATRKPRRRLNMFAPREAHRGSRPFAGYDYSEEVEHHGPEVNVAYTPRSDPRSPLMAPLICSGRGTWHHTEGVAS